MPWSTKHSSLLPLPLPIRGNSLRALRSSSCAACTGGFCRLFTLRRWLGCLIARTRSGWFRLLFALGGRMCWRPCCGCQSWPLRSSWCYPSQAAMHHDNCTHNYGKSNKCQFIFPQPHFYLSKNTHSIQRTLITLKVCDCYAVHSSCSQNFYWLDYTTKLV